MRPAFYFIFLKHSIRKQQSSINGKRYEVIICRNVTSSFYYSRIDQQWLAVPKFIFAQNQNHGRNKNKNVKAIFLV